MKKLLTIALIILCSIGFGQTKVQVLEGEIVRTGIPSKFERPNGQTIWGGYDDLPDSIHYVDGFRDLVMPVYNPVTQRIENRHYDLVPDVVTYDVVDKTEAELEAEIIRTWEILDQEVDMLAIKRILGYLLKPVLNSDSIRAEQLTDLATVYPQWRPGHAYAVNDVVVKDSTLYRIVQAHTSQADWLPDATPALYTAYTPPGQVAEWVQPTGAQDAYNTGDRVLFNGSTYESLINANTWSPTAYPAGWQLIP